MEICVLGGGIAGLVTSSLLCDAGFDVTLLEAGDFTEYRSGECLVAKALETLRTLRFPNDVISKFSIPTFETLSVWGSSTVVSRSSVYNPWGEGVLLSRPEFDFNLATYLEERGVTLRKNHRVSLLARNQNGWHVMCRNDKGEVLDLDADFIVDATGRNSKLTRVFGAKKYKYDYQVALTSVYRTRGCVLSPGTILVASVQKGWWYLAHLGQRIIATFVTDSCELLRRLSTEQNFAKFREYSSEISEVLDPLERLGAPCIVSAQTQTRSRLAGPRWIAVGDAAWSPDPLSSQGNSNAITMGLAATKTILATVRGDESAVLRYEREQTWAFVQHLRQRHAVYREEQRWVDESFWKRRHESCWAGHPVEILPCDDIGNISMSASDYLPPGFAPSVDEPLLLESINKNATVVDALCFYRRRFPDLSPDQELIVALQELLKRRRQGIDG